MSAGTLTLTNNTDAVTGTGTTFTTELVAGDFIVAKVGGITYTLPVKTVGSDTQAVLVSKYPGPTLAGIAWQAVPRESQNQVTAELVAQTTAALRGLNYDKQNWQAVFSASGDITVVLPDGSTFTGPSWQNIKDTLALIDIDAVTALANQVRTDALQVSTDKGAVQSAAQAASADASTASSAKTAAVEAKTAAETAKTDSETAKTAAVSAKTDAEAAKTAAEAAASSVHPENLLHKDQNLDDLPDKSAARGHLDVYSKSETYGKTEVYIKTETYSQTEVDAKNTATNARIGYSLLTVTNPALNSRTVITNPFGNNVPVICSAEFFHATLQKWVSTAWICTPGGQSYGFTASNSEGEGVILRVGNMAYSSATVSSGNNQELTANYTTLSPVRIHVWKVTA